MLCQQTSPKLSFGNINMTSNCDVKNSTHPVKMNNIHRWKTRSISKSPFFTHHNDATGTSWWCQTTTQNFKCTGTCFYVVKFLRICTYFLKKELGKNSGFNFQSLLLFAFFTAMTVSTCNKSSQDSSSLKIVSPKCAKKHVFVIIFWL